MHVDDVDRVEHRVAQVAAIAGRERVAVPGQPLRVIAGMPVGASATTNPLRLVRA